jgi:hypothetical protein
MHPAIWFTLTSIEGREVNLNLNEVRICNIEGLNSNNSIVQWSIAERVYSSMVTGAPREIRQQLEEFLSNQNVTETRQARAA